MPMVICNYAHKCSGPTCGFGVPVQDVEMEDGYCSHMKRRVNIIAFDSDITSDNPNHRFKIRMGKKDEF